MQAFRTVMLFCRGRPRGFGTRGGLRRSLSLLLASLWCLLLAACGTESAGALRVGTVIWPGYEPLYLARSLGYFDQAQVHLVEATSATQVMQLLHGGHIEAAALTLDEALSVLHSGTAVKVVAVLDVSLGGDALLTRPRYARLTDLRGARIAVEKTAVGRLLLQGALAASGLTAADLDLRYYPADQHAYAYRSGLVDAVVTFEPVKSELLQAGASALFDSSQIPGRIIDVLVVRAEVAAQQPAQVRALLRGYFGALEYHRKSPEDAIARMAPRLQLPPEAVAGSFLGLELPGLVGNREWLGGEQPRLNASAIDLMALMIDQGMLPGAVTLDGLSEPGFLP